MTQQTNQYEQYMHRLYDAQRTEKKLVHVNLDNWIIGEIEKVQQYYKEATGGSISTTQIIRKAVIEHVDKTLRSIIWHKAMEGRKQQQQQKDSLPHAVLLSK